MPFYPYITRKTRIFYFATLSPHKVGFLESLKPLILLCFLYVKIIMSAQKESILDANFFRLHITPIKSNAESLENPKKIKDSERVTK